MKKTYQAPVITIIELKHCSALLQASATGLDGFGGSGGSTGGKSADSRRHRFDDYYDEEEEEDMDY